MRAARSKDEGNSGLAGMAQAVLLDRRRWLLRPFLPTRRADIRAFLTKEGQGWIDDPSNVDPHYERVRVRGRLARESPFDAAAQAAAAVRRTALSDEAARLVREHVTIAQGVLAHLDIAGLQGSRPCGVMRYPCSPRCSGAGRMRWAATAWTGSWPFSMAASPAVSPPAG